MTTRVTFSNGEVVDWDEERDVHPSGAGAVVSREYLGPSAPEARPGEDKAAQRDRLRAELAALDDDEATGPAAGPRTPGARTPVPGTRPPGGDLFPPVT